MMVKVGFLSALETNTAPSVEKKILDVPSLAPFVGDRSLGVRAHHCAADLVNDEASGAIASAPSV